MNDIDTDELLRQSLREGIREGIKSRLTGYNSPIDKLVAGAVEKYGPEMKELLEESIQSCLKAEEFRQHVADAVNSNLAKVLIQRFGGEVEKQVNALKSDPTTRARITLAIEQIVKDANK